MYLLVIKQLVIMILIAVAAFSVSKAFKFGTTEQQFVSKILIYFINPCLIVSRFNMDFETEKLKAFLVVLSMAVALHFAMILVALLFCRSKSEETRDLDSIDRIALVFTNCGFIGIPLIDGIFPNSQGVFYLLAFIITFNVFLWTFGYMMLCGKINVKKIVTNPNIIAVVIGFAIFCLPFKLPVIISIPLGSIASMNTAMAMFLLGLLFANFHGFQKSYIGRLAKLCVLRFVVVMAISLLIVFAFYHIYSSIPDIRLMCYVCYIAALCPVGMSVSSFAVLFNKDESYAGLSVLATSVVCVITLPLSVAIAELVF